VFEQLNEIGKYIQCKKISKIIGSFGTLVREYKTNLGVRRSRSVRWRDETSHVTWGKGDAGTLMMLLHFRHRW